MQCQAFTKSGTQCSRKPEAGSRYCWQHQNYNANITPEIKYETKIIENKIVEDEDWEPKSDEGYYGKIPANVTLEQLKYILAKGLRAYKADAMAHGYVETDENLEGLLDAWFEHDQIREDKFDHLVTDDISEQFYSDVMALVNNKKVKL
jgi:hypothetical protein